MASTSTKTSKKGKAAVVIASVPEEPNVVVETESHAKKISELEALIDTLSKRVADLEIVVNEVKASGGSKTENTKEAKPEKKVRAPTAYNIYMKTKMVELKETHPDKTNIERMKIAAEAWTESKKNSPA